MDPDFMKRGNADRPFSPAQEQPLLRWIATVLVLLALVYAGYRVWVFSSGRAVPPKSPPAASVSPKSSPSVRLAPSPQRATQPQQTAPMAAAPGTRIVTKCVVNGKTVYSDSTCPQGAAGTQVVTKADHNLMTGLTPAQMAAADRIQPAAPSLSTFAQTGNSPSSSASECKALDEYIKYLDAMARQPQSMQTQDWIRDERKKTRDKQARIPCR